MLQINQDIVPNKAAWMWKHVRALASFGVLLRNHRPLRLSSEKKFACNEWTLYLPESISMPFRDEREDSVVDEES